MTIKRMEHIVIGSDLKEESYHFKNNASVVDVLDSNDSAVGNIQELLIEGKLVTSKSFKDIKVTGVYKVKDMKDFPKDVDVSKMHILSVDAVGKINSPEIVKYELTTNDGKIKSCVYSNGRYTPWSDGGEVIQRSIETIRSEIGNITTLKTTDKKSVVSAINELAEIAQSAKDEAGDIVEDLGDYKGHHHDDRYVSRRDGKMLGHLTLARGYGLTYIDSYGRNESVIYASSGVMYLGGTNENEVRLVSRTGKVTSNGNEIWHKGNDGVDSGLDADLLGGESHREYLKKGDLKTIENDLSISRGNGLKLLEETNTSSGKITWARYDGYERATLGVDSTSKMSYKSQGQEVFSVSNNGQIENAGKTVSMATYREGGMVIKLNSADKGMGIYRNNSSKYLGIYNWDKNKRIGYVSHEDEMVYFDRAISIQEKKLWLQNSKPNGAHKIGDIWIG